RLWLRARTGPQPDGGARRGDAERPRGRAPLSRSEASAGESLMRSMATIIRMRFGESRDVQWSYLDARPEVADEALAAVALSRYLRIVLPAARNSNGTSIRLHLIGEQHFYSLGQGGSFDRLHAPRRLWNCHVNRAGGSDVAIPLLVSNVGYALF